MEAELAERRFDQLRQPACTCSISIRSSGCLTAPRRRGSLDYSAVYSKLRSDRGTKDLGFRLELAEAYGRWLTYKRVLAIRTWRRSKKRSPT
jgi:hypothetical protein